jgi:pantothenate kinase
MIPTWWKKLFEGELPDVPIQRPPSQHQPAHSESDAATDAVMEFMQGIATEAVQFNRNVNEICRRRAEAIKFSDKMYRIANIEPDKDNTYPSLASRVKATTPDSAMAAELELFARTLPYPHKTITRGVAELRRLTIENEMIAASLFRVFQDQTEFEENLKTLLGLTDADCADRLGDFTQDAIIKAVMKLTSKVKQ